ncbi:G-protein coupled receptor 4-like, partial [Centropristis striata]|uniref:G-protein coupled receptor 4-like n=1 Tax=Centropristis striata TaxID=184440 RepID=UPI0027E0AA47
TVFVENCLLICIGLPLTLGAIYGLLFQVKNGEVAPIYVINLLISDLIQFCCMIVEVAQLQNVYSFSPKYWDIFEVFKYIYDYGLVASIGFMVCIALERYLVIVHPLWYRFRRTIKTSVLVCVLVWIIPLICVFTEYSFGYEVSLVIFAIFYLLPLPLILYFLITTLKALYASISVPPDEKRRIAGMLILVLMIYALLFLPTIIVNLYMYDQGSNPYLQLLNELAPMFLKLSPLADLVLYLIMRKGTIRQLSACLCCCKTDSNEISTATVNISAERDGEKHGEGVEEKNGERIEERDGERICIHLSVTSHVDYNFTATPTIPSSPSLLNHLSSILFTITNCLTVIKTWMNSNCNKSDIAIIGPKPNLNLQIPHQEHLPPPQHCTPPCQQWTCLFVCFPAGFGENYGPSFHETCRKAVPPNEEEL